MHSTMRGERRPRKHISVHAGRGQGQGWEGTKIMNEKKKEKRWKEWASKPVACAASVVNLKQCRAATLCQQEKQLMLSAAGKGQRTGGVHNRQDGDHCHFKLQLY